jgi:hypothetical protein
LEWVCEEGRKKGEEAEIPKELHPSTAPRELMFTKVSLPRPTPWLSTFCLAEGQSLSLMHWYPFLACFKSI